MTTSYKTKQEARDAMLRAIRSTNGRALGWKIRVWENINWYGELHKGRLIASPEFDLTVRPTQWWIYYDHPNRGICFDKRGENFGRTLSSVISKVRTEARRLTAGVS